MTLQLQIESLSLTGVDVSRSQQSELQAALEAELARLLRVQGVPPGLRDGANIAQLPINLALAGKASPRELGERIARSIYSDLISGGRVHV